MSSHTERTHRLLSLWLDLQRAFRQSSESFLPPWECTDPEVSRLWEKITEPKNQRVLEEWLYQSVDGQPEEWARKALQACRDRQGSR